MPDCFRRSGRALVLLAASSALAACATGPRPPALRPAAAAAPSIADQDADRASVYGLYLAGETALDRGATGDAAYYLGRASAHEPSQPLIRERAFAAALVAGEIDRAAALAPTSEEGSPTAYALGQLTRAVIALAHDDGKAAYALLSGASLREHSEAILLLKPWAAAAAGDWKTATRPVEAGKDQAVAAFGALDQAILLEISGRNRAAETVYQQAATRGGVFALAYGAFLERRGRRTDAEALYTRGLAHDPTDPAFAAAKARASAGRKPPRLPTVKEGASESLIGPAALLLATKQGDSGLAYLRLSLRLDPHHDEAWILVGDAMDEAGDVEAARTAYRRVLPGSPEYTTAQGRLASSLQAAGETEAALELARATVAAAPDDPQALVMLADLLREDERYAESVAVLDKLIAAVPAQDAAAWRLYYMRGASLERTGKWEAAQADLEHALKLKPDDPEVLNYLGFTWADRGEHLSQALGLLEKARALQPDSGAIVDSLGWAYYRLGAYRQAVKELERAVTLDPADPEVNDHLGDAYWKVGRRLEARYQWDRVLTLDPDAGRRALAQTKLAAGLAPNLGTGGRTP